MRWIRWAAVGGMVLAVGVAIAVGRGPRRTPERADLGTTTEAERPQATATSRSSEGLGVAIELTDYATHRVLACGGTYSIESWVAVKVLAHAEEAGPAQLSYLTTEDGRKYWHAKAFTIHLKQGDQIIGRSDQWPDPDGSSATYDFRVELYRQTDQEHFPQASANCVVTVSKAGA